MGDGNAAGAIKYLDFLIEKGKATNGAINPLKIAFTKVMQTIDGKDTWGQTDIRSVDVDDYMHRFANLTLGKYSSESLTVYKSRVKKVVEWYIKFLDVPGWTPEIQRRNRSGNRSLAVASQPTPSYDRPAPAAESPAIVAAAPVTAPAASAAPAAPATIPASPERVVYPFPLSDGQLVHISLPFNLTKTDARRIGAFVESIGRDEN